MIKRTYTITKAEVLGINLDTEIAERREIIIKGKNISDREILKQARTEEFHAISVIEVTTAEKKYQIKEEDFLKYAEEINDEVRR